MMSGDRGFLPYSRHDLDDDDIAAILPVLRGDWLTTGPMVEAFENALCRHTKSRFAVACGSGTAGLHLAALALGLQPGDRVVVPAVTFLATANAFRHVGAEIIFADTDPDTGLMTPQSAGAAMARARKNPIKVIANVHLAGNVADPIAIGEIAAAHRASIVEDAAHAIGSTYQAEVGTAAPVGDCRYSKMAVFSFHPVKTITTGEGGGITLNDPALHRRLSQLRSHGTIREKSLWENRTLAFDRLGKPNPWYY
ncbi:MAG: aminotransferase class I/II-fold pyridoxal phosphate-dependent enzyme, partial [Dongiaceae bacterium]